MSCYAIGIGGSGTRVVESLLHLCLAGLGPDELTVVIVDLDVANGNIARLAELVETYQTVRRHARASTVPWLRTVVTLLAPRPWNPLGGTSGIPRLEEFFNLQPMKNTRPDLAALMQCCFDADELRQDLQGGFRALPAIGAAVFGATVGSGEPWVTLGRDLSQRASSRAMCRVAVTGSIFGGTGASGFPTVPRLLRSSINANQDKVAIGGVLLLPYFGFPSPSPTAGEVYARAEDFLVQAQSGLSYYADFIGSTGYDRVYVVGDETWMQYEARPWGPTQNNPAHYVELLAATAALSFFRDPNCRDRNRPVAVVARESQNEFGWRDVPLRPQALMGQSARAAFAFARSIYPTALQIASGSKRRVPWFVSLVAREGLNLGDEAVRNDLDLQLRLARMHLEWLGELQGARANTVGGVTRRLFDHKACVPLDNATQWDESRFSELVFESPDRNQTIDRVWRRLAAISPEPLKRLGAKGLGILQSALYTACA